MADNDWKRRLGVVYSTNPDFSFTEQEEESVETLEPSAQKLIVSIDRKNRGGKQVTLVKGFVGSPEDLAEDYAEEISTTDLKKKLFRYRLVCVLSVTLARYSSSVPA